jgi:hypothetical protein
MREFGFLSSDSVGLKCVTPHDEIRYALGNSTFVCPQDPVIKSRYVADLAPNDHGTPAVAPWEEYLVTSVLTLFNNSV